MTRQIVSHHTHQHSTLRIYMQQIIEDKIKLRVQVHELEDEMKDLKL